MIDIIVVHEGSQGRLEIRVHAVRVGELDTDVAVLPAKVRLYLLQKRKVAGFFAVMVYCCETFIVENNTELQ